MGPVGDGPAAYSGVAVKDRPQGFKLACIFGVNIQWHPRAETLSCHVRMISEDEPTGQYVNPM